MGYLKLKSVLQRYFPTPNINYRNLNYFTGTLLTHCGRQCPQFLAMYILLQIFIVDGYTELAGIRSQKSAIVRAICTARLPLFPPFFILKDREI